MAKDNQTNVLEKAWMPAKYARVIAEARQPSDPGLFNTEPDDLLKDPRSGVCVSRQGKYRGTRKAEMKEVEFNDDGQRYTANALKDGLDRMKDKGNISEDAYKAARLFQKEFDRAGYDHYSKNDLNMTGGGGSVENVFAASQESRNYVHRILQLLGGPGNPMASVMFWSVGLGYSFDKISSEEGDSKHYWRGVFFAAIKLMEQDYIKMCNGSGRRTRFSGYGSDR